MSSNVLMAAILCCQMHVIFYVYTDVSEEHAVPEKSPPWKSGNIGIFRNNTYKI
jgi:hypothetical protein